MSFRGPNVSRLVRGVSAWLLLGAVALGVSACTSKTPEERLEEAVLMMQQGQLARGVLELRTIVRENPGDPASAQARMILAQYYAREGNAPRAIEELEAVYAQYGRQEDLGWQAADALMGIRSQIGDLEGALKLADEAIKAVGEDDRERRGEYQMMRATILVDQGTDESTGQGVEALRGLMLEAESPWQRGQAREILANIHRQKEDFEGSNAIYREYLDAFPEDRIRSRIELAMAVNAINGGDKEKGRADFEAAAAKLMGEADAELDREQKTQMLQELAAFYQSIEDLAGAEQVMLKIMAENAMSLTAIQTQFGIAAMYLTDGIQKENEAHFDRGMEILEQIKRENPNSNFVMNADELIAMAKDMRESYRAQQAAAAAEGEVEIEVPPLEVEGETPALTTAP